MIESDFWWLNASDQAKFKCVKLGHHKPIRDDDQPCSIKWDNAICLISNIDQWRNKFQNTNIYRSLKVLSTPSGGQEILGPFLIDIDSECENLEDALDITRKAMGYLTQDWKLGNANIRIFFTGRKGFNIEVLPAALDIQGSIQDQIKSSSSVLDQIIDYLRGKNTWGTSNQVSDKKTVIDRIYGNRTFGYGLKHSCLRLHNSWNEWIASNVTQRRRKIQLSINSLRKITIQEILTGSQNQKA